MACCSNREIMPMNSLPEVDVCFSNSYCNSSWWPAIPAGRLCRCILFLKFMFVSVILLQQLLVACYSSREDISAFSLQVFFSSSSVLSQAWSDFGTLRFLNFLNYFISGTFRRRRKKLLDLNLTILKHYKKVKSNFYLKSLFKYY